MCDITAYLISNGLEEKILENVDIVEETSNGIRLINIFGEEKSIHAKIVRFNNSEKKMIFKPTNAQQTISVA
jgi:predicted RNA-binding protein